MGCYAAGFRWDLPESYNISESCCAIWAAHAPDRVALIHLSADGSEQRWTYGMLERAASSLANAFAARGLQRGDRLAILLQQGPAVPALRGAADQSADAKI